MNELLSNLEHDLGIPTDPIRECTTEFFNHSDQINKKRAQRKEEIENHFMLNNEFKKTGLIL